MNNETTIIDTIQMELWNETYEITKAEINVSNKNRAERVFIRKIGNGTVSRN